MRLSVQFHIEQHHCLYSAVRSPDTEMKVPVFGTIYAMACNL